MSPIPVAATKKKFVNGIDEAKSLLKDPFLYTIGKGAEIAIDHILFDKARREQAAYDKSQADPNRKWQRDVGGLYEYGPETEIAGRSVQPRIPIQGGMRGLVSYSQATGKALTGNAPVDQRMKTLVMDSSIDANKRTNVGGSGEAGNVDWLTQFFTTLGRFVEGVFNG